MRGFGPQFWHIPGLGASGSAVSTPPATSSLVPGLALVPALVLSGSQSAAQKPVELDRRIPVCVIEMTGYEPATREERTFYFAHGTGFATGPNDSPAHQHFDARLKQPVDVTTSIFAPGATGGRTSLAFGDAVLDNSDGALDGLIKYGWDGRRFVVRYGYADTPYPAAFETVFDGTMEHPDFTVDAMTVKLRDAQRFYDVPLQSNRYTGVGALEGEGTDLKDTPKPLVFGTVANVSIPLVDPGRLIYQINDGAVAGPVTVYDRGVALVTGAPYASQAEMMSASPAPGTARVWLGGGFVRLGDRPDGLVTADVVETWRTNVDLFQRVMARATVGPTLMRPFDVALAAAVATPGAAGLFVDEERTIVSVLDEIAASAGAWWGVNGTGQVRLQVLDTPRRAPVLSITANDMLEPPARQRTTDPSRGLPIKEQVLRYGRNYTVQPTDVASTVPAQRRAEIGQEWRSVAVARPGVAVAHLLAETVTEDTLFVFEEAARAEAERRLRLRGVQRHRFDVVVQLTPSTMALELGDVVGVNHPRFGLQIAGNNVGQRFIVIGLQPDAARRRLRVTVWGAAFDDANLATRQPPRALLVTNTGRYFVTSLGLDPTPL